MTAKFSFKKSDRLGLFMKGFLKSPHPPITMGASQVVLVVKNLPANTGSVRDRGSEKEEMASGILAHSSVLV